MFDIKTDCIFISNCAPINPSTLFAFFSHSYFEKMNAALDFELVDWLLPPSHFLFGVYNNLTRRGLSCLFWQMTWTLTELQSWLLCVYGEVKTLMLCKCTTHNYCFVAKMNIKRTKSTSSDITVTLTDVLFQPEVAGF